MTLRLLLSSLVWPGWAGGGWRVALAPLKGVPSTPAPFLNSKRLPSFRRLAFLDLSSTTFTPTPSTLFSLGVSKTLDWSKKHHFDVNIYLGHGTVFFKDNWAFRTGTYY